MQVLKTLYNVNTRGLKRIIQDNSYFNENYLKDKNSIELKSKFDNFTKLLKQNREIVRGKGRKLKVNEIESITSLSKSKSKYYSNL